MAVITFTALSAANSDAFYLYRVTNVGLSYTPSNGAWPSSFWLDMSMVTPCPFLQFFRSEMEPIKLFMENLFTSHFVSFCKDCERAKINIIVIKLFSNVTMEQFLKKDSKWYH